MSRSYCLCHLIVLYYNYGANIVLAQMIALLGEPVIQNWLLRCVFYSLNLVPK